MAPGVGPFAFSVCKLMIEPAAFDKIAGSDFGRPQGRPGSAQRTARRVGLIDGANNSGLPAKTFRPMIFMGFSFLESTALGYPLGNFKPMCVSHHLVCSATGRFTHPRESVARRSKSEACVDARPGDRPGMGGRPGRALCWLLLGRDEFVRAVTSSALWRSISSRGGRQDANLRNDHEGQDGR